LRIVYLAPADLQVARVDRQCIVAFCAALRRLGLDVELVAMRIGLVESELRAADPLELYRVREPPRLRLVRVPVHQESRGWWIGGNRLFVHVGIGAWRAVRSDDDRQLVLYEKSHAPALALALLGRLLPRRPLLVFEAHLPPRTRLQRLALRRADLVVANTHALARDLVAGGAVSRERVIGTHQGVDLEPGRAQPTKEEARERLGLSVGKRLAVYTGKIYDGYQEVEYLLRTARHLLRDPEIELVLVGGRPDHADRLRRRAAGDGIRNVVFTGFVPPTVVPEYQRAADVLLLYYPSGMELNDYRSPGKLFEYMASGRPIVSVDLPVLREVLGDPPAARLVRPDSPHLLAEAITGLLADPEEAARLVEQARRRVEGFTWDARARAVVDAVEHVRRLRPKEAHRVSSEAA
jgi:glycosyltransferase involved in cell wall biosynthesis